MLLKALLDSTLTTLNALNPSIRCVPPAPTESHKNCNSAKKKRCTTNASMPFLRRKAGTGEAKLNWPNK